MNFISNGIMNFIKPYRRAALIYLGLMFYLKEWNMLEKAKNYLSCPADKFVLLKEFSLL